MIEFISLSKSNKPFAKALYEASFPINERREFVNVEQLCISKQIEFFVIEKKHCPIAILSLWSFEQFAYIEHFAISFEHRNNGYGTKIMKNLQTKISKPIVLEVELPLNAVSQKRIKFYERLGFVLLKNDYLQPPYDKNKHSVDMKIMVSNANIARSLSFEQIKDTLYRKVYGLEK